MSKKNKDKEKEKEQPGVHEELKGFNIRINELGEITSSLRIEKLNQFLDKNVEDRKLKDRQEEE